MLDKQRDIIELNFLMPNGESKPHPAVVVSNNELFEVVHKLS
jgi:hypothetical protein